MEPKYWERIKSEHFIQDSLTVICRNCTKTNNCNRKHIMHMPWKHGDTLPIRQCTSEICAGRLQGSWRSLPLMTPEHTWESESSLICQGMKSKICPNLLDTFFGMWGKFIPFLVSESPMGRSIMGDWVKWHPPCLHKVFGSFHISPHHSQTLYHIKSLVWIKRDGLNMCNMDK